jgi:NADH-ubiquinone reductase complex 1 MLRQ subunit
MLLAAVVHFFSHRPSGVARRWQSSSISTTFLTKSKEETFKKNWLSDPSTYPLLVALGSAVALCTGFGFSFLMKSPDVRISSVKKRSTLREWK